ncbi:hypothetical protein [Marinicrinis sediminis]|uniref:Uncharacterized protein n=1 Tax=Marinicrinis sediminis TaxID=1652465 RepID=A0ABW5R8Y9_9BACL
MFSFMRKRHPHRHHDAAHDRKAAPDSKQSRSMQQRIEALEAQLSALKKDTVAGTVQVDYIHVERLVIDQPQFNHHFGQLGIKELSGKLNIGATSYGNLDAWLQDDKKEKKPKNPEKGPRKAQGPDVHIRAKPGK